MKLEGKEINFTSLEIIIVGDNGDVVASMDDLETAGISLRNSWYIAKRSKSKYFSGNQMGVFHMKQLVTGNNIIIDITKTQFLTWPLTVHSF